MHFRRIAFILALATAQLVVPDVLSAAIITQSLSVDLTTTAFTGSTIQSLTGPLAITPITVNPGDTLRFELFLSSGQAIRVADNAIGERIALGFDPSPTGVLSFTEDPWARS